MQGRLILTYRKKPLPAQVKIDFIRCFCTHDKNSGNPAAIVQNCAADERGKQRLAKELNTPVTVFISNPEKENYSLEFFYPDTEMPLCLHGTIGAAYFLFNDTGLDSLTCFTKSNNKLFIRRKDDLIQVHVAAHVAPEIPIQKTEIFQMLNLASIDEIDSALPLQISSVGSPKLLIPLVSLESLSQLKPDFDLISKWSIENRVNGFYVYVKNPKETHSSFFARGFNPKTGHNEDAATGVAAAALALALKQNITISQGAFIQRPSRIEVSYDNPNEIWVGGKTKIIR